MKTLRIAIIGLAAFALAGSASANPWYVATDGDGSDGLTWATAWQDLQTAINAASDDDTIYIKGETFTLQQPDPVQEEGLLVWTNKPLTILGGYAGDGTPGALSDTSTVLRNTTETVSGSTGENRRRILYIKGVANGTLGRVTLAGGRIGSTGWAPSIPGTRGAGMFIEDCQDLLIDDVIVEHCSHLTPFDQTNRGGGIYALSSTGIITNSIVRANDIRGKRGTLRGSGIYIENGAWTIRDSVIRDNLVTSVSDTPTYQGCGIFLNAGTHVLRNVLLSRNGAGAAVYVTGAGADVSIENATLYRNATYGVRQVNGTVAVRDSILWENGSADVFGTVALQYSNTSDGTDAGNNGNISVDPRFVRGLFLAPDSDCVDAGSRSVDAAGLTGYTTSADGTADTGMVNMGYHWAPGTAAVDYFVDAQNGDDGNSGLASGSAFATISRALESVGDGTRIHIAPGVYNLALGETFPLSVRFRHGVQLLGAGADLTIIDATPPVTYGNRGIEMERNYPDARISGLTVTGVYHFNADVYPFPQGWRPGGGIVLLTSEAVVADSISRGNTVRHSNSGDTFARMNRSGAGIYAAGGEVVITNTVIEANAVRGWRDENVRAAGVFASGNILLTHCEILSNTNTVTGTGVSASGGGLFLAGATMRNCLVAGNVATGSGANHFGDGIFVSSGTVAIESSTIVDNEGEGIRRSDGTVSVDNSILWNNGIDAVNMMTVNWSNVGTTSGTVTTNNCISTDPFFIASSAGNYRLRVLGGPLSPSVNAGNPVAEDWMIAGIDLDGNPRILNKRVDQGAFENFVPPPGSLILLR